MFKKLSFIIGLDEVGRGPLAGPVTVAAILLINNQRLATLNTKLKLKDSKKLSQKQREEWAKWIKNQKIPCAISSISPKAIDKMNITQAANLAASKTLAKLLTRNPHIRTNNCKVFLDGGLYIGTKKLKHLNTKKLNAKTIIKGDEKIPAISLASIVAKVHRDKFMEKMHKKYPKYHFHKHKGYGTKLHYQMIKKYGASKIHRESFLKK